MSGTTIEILDGMLVVLIGAAGAGKSTLAARLFAPSEVISSDALRAAISGDPADQGATRPAFARLHRDVANRIAAGRTVVVDATNVEATARRSVLRLARDARAPALAIVLRLDRAEAHHQNASRSGRTVPADVVDRHLDRLAAMGADPGAIERALLAEGFAQVVVVRSSAEAADLRVVRTG